MTDAPRPDPALPAESTSGDPRADRVATAVKAWQRSLVDLGGRNTLLWYRDLPSGTLDLTTAHPGGVSMLLAGRRTRLSDLMREPAALAEARRRARAIRAKAQELKEERGIAAGFLAIGMATWTVPRAPRPPAAPVLLWPLELRPTGPAQDDFDIRLGPEVEFNPVLIEYLRSEQSLEVDGEALADLATRGDTFDPYPVFAALQEKCADVPDLAIAPRLVIGTFSYAKLPMVADLALQGSALADHDVVAALAGDESALAAVRLRVPGSDPEPDPEHEHLVLDADSSQHAAIDAVRAGAHLVIKGPPGTGKSQTIANLIAALAAEGKSTLFVAEKRAAIDAVLGRLDRLGLSDLVLDAYDGMTNRRAAAQQFARTLDWALREESDTPGLDVSGPGAGRGAPEIPVSVLRDRRSRLVAHLQAMHAVREPWGVSVHQVQEALAELATRQPSPTSRVRLSGPTLARLNRDRIRDLAGRLRDAAGLGAWSQDGDDPWFGARLLTPDEAARALDITTRYSTTELEEAAGQLNAILGESHVPAAASLADWQSALETMSAVRHTLEVFRPEVFDLPLDEHIAATASREWRDERAIDMGWLTRWKVRQQAKRLLRPGRPPQDLHRELVSAREQRQQWFALVGGGGRPTISPRLDEALAVQSRLLEDLHWLEERLPAGAGGSSGGAAGGTPGGPAGGTPGGAGAGQLTTLSLADLRDRLAALAARPDRVAVLPHVTKVLDDLREAGLGPLIDEFARRGVAPAAVPGEVDLVWWASLAQEISLRDPAYGAHDGAGLRRIAEEFAAADRSHLAATVPRVREAVARNIREVLGDNPAQEALVRAEAGRARRHKPLRDLMPAASTALTAIKPCWAMSPLVVASTLPPGRWFDVVIFDEASQVQPAQAISAVSRGRQVVVAGDERQLPPTNFFTVVSDDEGSSKAEEEVLTEGFESVLDVLAAALPTRRLTWHYRSRDERLIAFSNAAVYDGGLTTFPGTAVESALTFEPVAGHAVVQPGEQTIESTSAEVERVVSLVLDHARRRPRESLGVIALGIKHATRLDEAITAALRDAPDAAPFFDPDRNEHFFVKNLERVQGDERDAIILSIGYGKTPHGRVLHRFGPLNIEGGERRLNVAITRARSRMTVVSSLAASDLDPARLKARGALMLRDFLAYAESKGTSLPSSAAAAREPARDALRADLAARLRREGLVVHEDYGSADQRIDLAIEDPYHRGRVLVAVETDGPRYAALRSTRDRDRLRPEQLSRLGWLHLRVWTTDLFRDPAREISRIVRAARDDRAPTPSHETVPAPARNGSAAPAVRASDTATPSGPAEAEEASPVSDVSAADEGPGRRRRRRVFRKGTAESASDDAYGPTTDDTDRGWGEAVEVTARDQWLQDQRPPHYE
ncbi:AAA domain-containing protein [Intrasporangium sp. DVR]|uniref:AAA domain-containing protein n=1 Tax=Intrasporangium sp. DVR TaxID=3127867 RepID=UPI00313A5430